MGHALNLQCHDMQYYLKRAEIQSWRVCGPSGKIALMWLSATGALGDGTGRSATNAADASTQVKYDALYIGVTNTIFNYLPGTYQTKGWLQVTRQSANSGVQHFGAGIDQTIIQLVGASAAINDGTIFGNDYNVRSDNFGLHFLTLDCNAINQPKWLGAPGGISAISVMGNNLIFEHVKIINFGTSLLGAECFPAYINAGSGFSSTTFSNILMASCIFTQPAIGNHDGVTCAVMFADSAFGNVLANAAIKGCSFLNIKSDFTYSHAFAGLLCSGNVVDDPGVGFYTEPNGLQYDYTITGNVFRNCSFAGQINWDDTATAGLGTVTFSNNQIISPALGTIFWINDSGLSVNRPVMQALIMQDNFCTVPPGGTRNGLQGIKLNSANRYGLNKLILTGNTIPVPPALGINTANTGIVSQLVQNNITDQ
jgi:hypothetical protein